MLPAGSCTHIRKHIIMMHILEGNNTIQHCHVPIDVRIIGHWVVAVVGLDAANEVSRGEGLKTRHSRQHRGGLMAHLIQFNAMTTL